MVKGKTKTVFFCKECGQESPKWMGQCPGCHAWNTMVEEEIVTSSKNTTKRSREQEAVPSALSAISLSEEDRISTGMKEMDRVLGGGIVPGSLILVGGDPGIGKSTLLLQTCRLLAAASRSVLYISGEESLKQIKMRADRIGTFDKDIRHLIDI